MATCRFAAISCRIFSNDSVFDPVVQVHRDLTTIVEATGLSLAISRDLARGMGGDLRVRRRRQQGSTFTLTLARVLSPVEQ
jgi:signal transduction histidine kinase